MIQAARVHAVMQGNDFIRLDNITAVIMPILRHRLVFKPGEVEHDEVEIRLHEIIDEIISKVL